MTSGSGADEMRSHATDAGIRQCGQELLLGEDLNSSSFSEQGCCPRSFASMELVRTATDESIPDYQPGRMPGTVSTRGVICHETPHLSLHQPHALSWPPLPTMAFQ